MPKDDSPRRPLTPPVKSPDDYRTYVQSLHPADHTLTPGKRMPDGSIYLGTYTPITSRGVSLSKTFNVFAAPENLPATMNYRATLAFISGMKNWHGHDGAAYETDDALFNDLKNNSYNGGWTMPTRELLCGWDVNNKIRMADNMFTHKNTGAFKETFQNAQKPAWYISLSICPWESSEAALVNLTDKDTAWWPMDDEQTVHCRPVRFEEIRAGKTP